MMIATAYLNAAFRKRSCRLSWRIVISIPLRILMSLACSALYVLCSSSQRYMTSTTRLFSVTSWGQKMGFLILTLRGMNSWGAWLSPGSAATTDWPSLSRLLRGSVNRE